MNSTSELGATYYGFIGSTYDALLLFEACIIGHIKHVSRRPHDTERGNVIQSGRIFIYEEKTSGIKRWTDGISWSPSRILGNFLIYRQLAKAFGPGEKKKAIKKPKAGANGVTKNNQNNNIQGKETFFQGVGDLQVTGRIAGRASIINAKTERALIGSLTDSYDFLEDGLVKKTISITCDDVTHHLVSYYTIADAMSHMFMVPSMDPRFAQTRPRPSLLTSQNFRNPIEEIDSIDQSTYPRVKYETADQGLLYQTPLLTTPECHSSYTGKATGSLNYTMPITPTLYGTGLPTCNLTLGCATPYIPAPRIDQYDVNYKRELPVTDLSSSNSNCASISTVLSLKRDAPVFHQRELKDSSFSTPMDKNAEDSPYSEALPGSYGVPRDVFLTPNFIATRKARTNLSQTNSKNRRPDEGIPSNIVNRHSTIPMDNNDAWQRGNASAGHGHYQMCSEAQSLFQ